MSFEQAKAQRARPSTLICWQGSGLLSQRLQLIGLDHSLVAEELGRWRSTTPEESGITVVADVEEPVLLSLWMVEASTGGGERRVVIQPIAIKRDGTRVPAVERNCERYLQAAAGKPRLDSEERLTMFLQFVELGLQRELRHKGAATFGAFDESDYCLLEYGEHYVLE